MEDDSRQATSEELLIKAVWDATRCAVHGSMLVMVMIMVDWDIERLFDHDSVVCLEMAEQADARIVLFNRDSTFAQHRREA